MTNDEIKEAYLYALQKGVTQGFIASKTGIPVGSLRKYKETSFLGEDKRKDLAEWLTREGYVNDFQVSSDPILVFAGELRNLADVLESKIPRTTKIKRIRALLTNYNVEDDFALNRLSIVGAAEDPAEYRP